jgi:hypothetical protein
MAAKRRIANLQIKRMPLELHEALRDRAERRGSSMRDYVLRLIESDLGLPTIDEWLAEVEASGRLAPDATAEQVAEAVREARAERSDQLLESLQRNLGRGEPPA